MLIQILELFCIGFYHNLIGTQYFDLIIFNCSFLIFGIGFNIISLKIEIIQLIHLTPDHKTKVTDEHQKNVWCILLGYSIEGDKPMIVNWLFLITLFIYGTETSK